LGIYPVNSYSAIWSGRNHTPVSSTDPSGYYSGDGQAGSTRDWVTVGGGRICGNCGPNTASVQALGDWNDAGHSGDVSGNMNAGAGTFSVNSPEFPGSSFISFATDLCCPTGYDVTITIDYTATYGTAIGLVGFGLYIDGTATAFHYAYGDETDSWSTTVSLTHGTHNINWSVGAYPNAAFQTPNPSVTGTVTVTPLTPP
jgi:hypothetical protein